MVSPQITTLCPNWRWATKTSSPFAFMNAARGRSEAIDMLDKAINCFKLGLLNELYRLPPTHFSAIHGSCYYMLLRDNSSTTISKGTCWIFMLSHSLPSHCKV